MKINMLTAKYLLLLGLSAGSVLSVTSCVVGPPPPGPVAGVSVGYYDTLPAAYDDPYYFYGNHYYYGGIWETGRYRWHGRYYDGRYRHNGHVFYGGRYDGGHHHGGAPAHPKGRH